MKDYIKTYADVERDVERDEKDIEISIEYAHDEKKINEKEYLELLCLIRIAEALKNLSYK